MPHDRVKSNKAGLMASFLANFGVGVEKKRGKHATIVRDGEVQVEDVDPRYVVKPKIAGQATSSSGFAKGKVASGSVDVPQR